MVHEYTVSRERAIEINTELVRKAAKNHGYSIEDSFYDWLNEGPSETWLVIGVKQALSIA